MPPQLLFFWGQQDSPLTHLARSGRMFLLKKSHPLPPITPELGLAQNPSKVSMGVDNFIIQHNTHETVLLC